MLPHAAPVHPTPETLQVTAVLEAPVTVAENCCCPPADTCAGLGVTLTEIEVVD